MANGNLLKALQECGTRDVLPFILNRFGLTGAAVEVGVAEGLHAESFRRSWHGAVLYLVDLWAQQAKEVYNDAANRPDYEQEAILEECRKRFEKETAAGSVIFRQMDSVAASKTFPDGFFDFVYLDANHCYDAVVRDIEAWMPKVRQGGILAGHDYVVPPNSTFGVQPAVDMLLPQRVIIPTPPGGHCSWAAIV